MDRPGIEAAINWANPELAHLDSAGHIDAAAEPEVFDLSTVDPSHFIHLIRQLLPSGARLDSAGLELLPVVSKSKTAEGGHSGKNGIIQEALQNVEGGTPPKNGIVHAGQDANKSSMRQDKAADISNTGLALQSPFTAVSTADLKSQGRSEAVSLLQEMANTLKRMEIASNKNGYHFEGNRELSRKRSRGGGNMPEQNGDSLEYIANGTSKTPEKPDESTSISLMSWKAEDNAEDGTPGTTDVESARREVDSDVHQKTSSEDDVTEEAGCVLWDLAATESHAEFLVLTQIQCSNTFLIASVSLRGRIFFQSVSSNV